MRILFFYPSSRISVFYTTHRFLLVSNPLCLQNIPVNPKRRSQKAILRLKLTNRLILSDGVVSYSAPESTESSQGLSDSSYDGVVSEGWTRGGLGRLVDGEIGMDNFRLDIGYGKGKRKAIIILCAYLWLKLTW